MTHWTYCGQFSYMSQEPIPGYGVIDEGEAKRRYHDPSAYLTFLPPVDRAVGIMPYFIVVTPGATPAFTIFEQIPPGVIQAEVMFSPTADGRLFARYNTMRSFPALSEILVRDNSLANTSMYVENREDGTGTVQVLERGSGPVLRADRDSIPVAALYRHVPAWGKWHLLREAPAGA